MLELDIYLVQLSKRNLRGRSWVIEMAFFCASKKTKSEATCQDILSLHDSSFATLPLLCQVLLEDRDLSQSELVGH